MKWLETNFKELPPNAPDIVKEQYVRAFILGLVGGILMLDKSQNLIHIRWNHRPSYVGLPEHVEDIRLLLDQHLKAEFEWMSYVDLDIIECILLEFLAIRGMWDAKKFGWRQNISPSLRDMEALHKLDLWRKTDENWQDYHKEYIDIWDRRMEFLPIREPFFSSDIATCLEYMP
ncbi:hypothetical protein Gotur_022175 [Gossypium turneri]